MDFIWVILFLLWVELLSLPLRWAIAGWSAPADVRRMLSRLAGPPLLALPVWLAAHAVGGMLERPAGLAWLGLTLAAGLMAGLRQTRSAGRLMGYNDCGMRNAECGIDNPRFRNPHSAIRNFREVGLDLFMVALVLGFAAFRRWVPEMTTYELDTSAAEKFGNAMIFWSNWHARSLPPEDYWLAGTPLSYYYWGHFHWAWVARLGGFPVALALNLGFAVAVTLVWTGAYLLARAARLGRGWAAGAALCVAWAGNPEAIRQVTPLLQGNWLFQPPADGTVWDWARAIPHWIAATGKLILTVPAAQWGHYDYWAPSRAIPNVVDEFPAFSAILGDFHAHHLALPWMTGWLALAVAGRRWWGGRPEDEREVEPLRGSQEKMTATPGSASSTRGYSASTPAGSGGGTKGPEGGAKKQNLSDSTPVGSGGGTKGTGSAGAQGPNHATCAPAELGTGAGVGTKDAKVNTEDAGVMSGPAGRTTLNAITWGLAWTALGSAAVLANLWNLPLLGLGIVVLLAAALRRGWPEFAAQLAWSIVIGAVMLAGMRLLRGGAPLPLPAADAPRGLLERLPIKLLEPRLRSPLANLFGLWGLPMMAIAAGAVWKCGMSNVQCQMSKDAGAEAGLGGEIPPEGGTTNAPSKAPLWLMLAGMALIVPHFSKLGVMMPGGVAWFWAGFGLLAASLMTGPRPWLDRPMGMLLLFGCAVLGGLEVAYLPDRFVGDFARYNSYFKFTYPVWPVLWVGAWVAAQRLWGSTLPGNTERAKREKPTRRDAASTFLRWVVLRPALLALLAAGAVYTVFAVPTRIAAAAGGDISARRPTLDAYAFVAQRALSAPEAPLLDWIRRHVPPGERVAEGAWPVPSADSPAYKYQGRVASLAGRPIPVGWVHHEQQWRGPVAYAALDERVAGVNALYTAPDPQELRRRAEALGVRWIIYGVHEAKLYGPATLDSLQTALPLAASFPEGEPSVFIFHVNQPNPDKMKIP